MPANAATPDIVVSQVYTTSYEIPVTGSCDNCPLYDHHFIELFNRGTRPVNVNGWSLQYAGGAYRNLTWQAITPLSGMFQPGQYVLVQGAAASFQQGDGLPTPDITDTTPISLGIGGRLAIVPHAEQLTGDPCTTAYPSVRDEVVYGPIDCPLIQTTTYKPEPRVAILRLENGCFDTDMRDDFMRETPRPRNSGSPRNPCPESDQPPAMYGASPGDGAVITGEVMSFSVVFTEPVSVADGWAQITCSQTGRLNVETSGGPVTFGLKANAAANAGEECTVRLVAARIHDKDTNDPPDTMAHDHVFSVTSFGMVTSIEQIQGHGHLSPLVGSSVTTNGVVHAVSPQGFWIYAGTTVSQLPIIWGIFVSTPETDGINKGDWIVVHGRIEEFRDDNPAVVGALSRTQITDAVAKVASKSLYFYDYYSYPTVDLNDIWPSPNSVTYRIPTQSVDDDPGDDIEISGVFDLKLDAVDTWERIEGQQVYVAGPVVGPTNRAGEAVILISRGYGAEIRTPRGGIIIRPNDVNLERIALGSAVAPVPALQVGGSVSGLGPVDYQSGKYVIHLINTPTPASTNVLSHEVTSSTQSADQLAIATFSLGGFEAVDAARAAALGRQIRENLGSPDIIVLQDVPDSNGAADGGVVDAVGPFALITSAIQAGGGPYYAYRQINPVANADSGTPGSNPRVGFLFRTDRGLSFVDRPGGTATTAVSVVAGADGPRLSVSPGRIAPTNPAFADTPKPLAGEFSFHGERLFVVAAQLVDKEADDPLFGRFQPPRRQSEPQRVAQAAVINGFVEQILAQDPDAKVAVAGAVNDFQWSAAVAALKGETAPGVTSERASGVAADGNGAALTNLIETLPENERYTHIADGNSQAIDHLLVSRGLRDLLVPGSVDVVHVNAEYPYTARASDHDPLVARFSLPWSTALAGRVRLQGRTETFPEGVGHGAATVTLALLGNGPSQTVMTAADGRFALADVPDGTYRLTTSADGYLRDVRSVSVTGGQLSGVVEGIELPAGDADGDGDVDISDISAIIAAFGSSPPERRDGQGRTVDLNGDGVVNLRDLTLALGNFGRTAGLG